MTFENLKNVRVQIVNLSSSLFVINERKFKNQNDRKDESPGDLYQNRKLLEISRNHLLELREGLREGRGHLEGDTVLVLIKK